jgi:hypothetical protein
MKRYIFNKAGDIGFPWEPGLLEWLQEHYPASKYYEVVLCAHIIDIEADQFDVSVTIYSTPKTKWWAMSRWVQIWTLLTKGYLEYETTTVMDKQVALNYAETLKSAVADVEQFQKERKSVKN